MNKNYPKKLSKKFVLNMYTIIISKKILIIIIFFIYNSIITCSYSQEYIPLLVNGNKWSVVHTEYPYGPFQTNKTIKTNWYKVFTDTIINAISYKIILSSVDSFALNWNFALLMREENYKVYIYNQGSTDTLLYDFGLNVNDSMVCKYWGKPKISKLITKNDTTIGNTARKKYQFKSYWEGNSNMTFPETWIEGIGSLNGITRWNCAGITPCHSDEELSCFYQNNQMYYQSCSPCKCYIFLTSINNLIGIDGLKITPIPASDHIEITSHSILSRFEIIDQNGILLKDGDIDAYQKKINIQDLKSGIFVIRVYDKNRRNGSMKFIVKLFNYP